MNSRQRVVKTLHFEAVDRIPRHLWHLPGVAMFRKHELAELLQKYPNDIESPVYQYGPGERCQGVPYQVGNYVDAWGCVWHVGEPGVVGEVKEPPLASWDALHHYRLPWELLHQADLSRVNRGCEQSTQFILAGTEARPFERMQFLRGTENLLIDLAYGEREVYQLRDMLHDFYVREMEMWADTAVDGVSFMDDWGSQQALLISPALWREFYKPLYRDYCDILHRKGKYAFFHSDGNIAAIYPDLIEIGINAVNSQLFCMDIETLGAQYGGRITFWGEIDRQRLLPFGAPDEVKKAVRRVAAALLADQKTGVIAQCEWGVRDPGENIAAVFEAWDQY